MQERAPFFFDPLYPFCADLIVCDPPWAYKLRSARGEAKSAQAQYRVMTHAQIRAAERLTIVRSA